jgi:hypothetical protein
LQNTGISSIAFNVFHTFILCIPDGVFSGFVTEFYYFIFHSKPWKQYRLSYLLVIQKMLLMEIFESDLPPLSPAHVNIINKLIIWYF